MDARRTYSPSFRYWFQFFRTQYNGNGVKSLRACRALAYSWEPRNAVKDMTFWSFFQPLPLK